jgi:capsular polysaccharide biosynthesis protein
VVLRPSVRSDVRLGDDDGHGPDVPPTVGVMQRPGLAGNAQQTSRARPIDALTAVRRHWFIALLPVVLFVAGAVVIGNKREPRYTSTANLSVGHVYITNPAGIPTILDATQSLAAVYSRAIFAGSVVKDTRARLRKQNSVPVSGSLNATPIPDSPLIKVSAVSSSPRSAVALANAGAAALANYVNNQIRDNNASVPLAERYRQAALEYRKRITTRNRMTRRYGRDPNAKNKDALDRAAAAADTALLRREAIRASYENAVQGGTSSVGVDVFSLASGASSDRSKKMQLYVFIGALGGLAAGVALALLRAAGDVRRGRV